MAAAASDLLVWFDPPPSPGELAAALTGPMPSPFAGGAPAPLARRAAEALQAELRAGRPLPPAAFAGDNRGKMFAVLVVEAGGRMGYLRAFSGMLGGSWQVPGFVGPLFDPAARDAWWPAAEAELRALDRRMEQLATGSGARALAAATAQATVQQQVAAALLAAVHQARRAQRARARAALAARSETGVRGSEEARGGPAATSAGGHDQPPGPPNRAAERGGEAPGGAGRVVEGAAAVEGGAAERGGEGAGGAGGAAAVEGGAAGPGSLRALARQSQEDATARRRMRAVHREEQELLAALARGLEQERGALKAVQAERSRVLTERLFEGYLLPSGTGRGRTLREVFAPEVPPGGAGDCAAPKLFGEALRRGLRPLALAEFWWGTPPPTGGRRPGVYYPPCRRKCGPVLAHMLAGLAVEPAPLFGARPLAADEPRTVYEDRWLVVVDKPAGLLSVPGRSGLLRDSVLTRLRVRYPEAEGPLIVHRLDLDTSGLLLVAKDRETHAALQRQFLRRQVDKRYIAWLEGDPSGAAGVIDLALRVDLDDRPRQIHDPVLGKAAVTEWRVLERRAGRTRVALHPRTGRTHQLRVHAAHPQGLAAPIVGDRLYGGPAGAPHSEGAGPVPLAADRLLLHAEALAFTHPHTGERLVVERPAPF